MKSDLAEVRNFCSVIVKTTTEKKCCLPIASGPGGWRGGPPPPGGKDMAGVVGAGRKSSYAVKGEGKVGGGSSSL